MNEEELRKLPENDEYGQCMRKLRIVPDHDVEMRKKEIRNCDHLFVKLRNGDQVHEFHSTYCYYDPNEVECVHCGLTNKFNKFEEQLSCEYSEYTKSFRGMIPSLTRYNKRTLESVMFEEVFKSAYSRGGKSFNNNVLPLINDECLPTNHSGLLYRLALQICPLGNNDELFEIMKQLHLLETRQERIRMQTEEHASSLLDRYYTSKSKKYVK